MAALASHLPLQRLTVPALCAETTGTAKRGKAWEPGGNFRFLNKKMWGFIDILGSMTR